MPDSAVTVDRGSDVGSVTSLLELLDEAAAKLDSDAVRFRTCCADPRASK